MFAIKCHGFPDCPFVNVKEYKTADAAKKAAEEALAEGWRKVELLKREVTAEVDAPLQRPLKASMEWKVLETIRR